MKESLDKRGNMKQNEPLPYIERGWNIVKVLKN